MPFITQAWRIQNLFRVVHNYVSLYIRCFFRVWCWGCELNCKYFSLGVCKKTTLLGNWFLGNLTQRDTVKKKRKKRENHLKKLKRPPTCPCLKNVVTTGLPANPGCFCPLIAVSLCSQTLQQHIFVSLSAFCHSTVCSSCPKWTPWIHLCVWVHPSISAVSSQLLPLWASASLRSVWCGRHVLWVFLESEP